MLAGFIFAAIHLICKAFMFMDLVITKLGKNLSLSNVINVSSGCV